VASEQLPFSWNLEVGALAPKNFEERKT